MKIFRSIAEVPENFGPSIISIGNFDGVHRGHRWVISEIIARARESGTKSIAVTFDPHPVRILRPDSPTKMISPTEEKLRLLAATGLDATLVLPFTQELAQTSAEDFISKIICDCLGATEVHVGSNFRFGYQAQADVMRLAELGNKLDFSARIYEPVPLRGGIISSSRIRQLILAGNLSSARVLLGRPYSICSTPARGRGYGTKYAVPTINLAPYSELLPANGVYVTTLQIGDDGPIFEGVTNAGNRPTFGPDSYAVETHLFNFHPVDMTEETPLRLTFLTHLRPEMKWDSPEALKAQIGKDIARAQRFLRGYRRLIQ
ncbi:bifunctional riboflavin kinase/FAD synthetase [Terriglobus albidus]|uniref:Riboflavin biosynthesis protein n=1 Tax=Terriglobus albidus TaxID=1592106 RepID=A0A5B9EFH0_9BACT|nr:bifunctional riboflavin kinase/FAD synthetase [Terriglobus albidus]QEE29855.1 bifunctional riboflavin kinase/FAD synthetase [Terriglobus albidus]